MKDKLINEICCYLDDHCYHIEDLQHYASMLNNEILDSKFPRTHRDILDYRYLANLLSFVKHEIIHHESYNKNYSANYQQF